MSYGTIPLFPGQSSQIRERPSNAPAVTEFAKDFQSLLVQCPRGCRVTLIAGDIPLRVQRPGHAGAIFKSLKDCQTLRVQIACVLILALQLEDVRQITESPSDGLQVAQFPP